MFLSLNKASKRVTLYLFFSLGALSFLEVQQSTNVKDIYIYIHAKQVFLSLKNNQQQNGFLASNTSLFGPQNNSKTASTWYFFCFFYSCLSLKHSFEKNCFWQHYFLPSTLRHWGSAASAFRPKQYSQSHHHGDSHSLSYSHSRSHSLIRSHSQNLKRTSNTLKRIWKTSQTNIKRSWNAPQTHLKRS